MPGILPDSTPSESSVLPTTPHVARTLPEGRRRIGDLTATRKLIYDNVLHAASNIAPVANSRHTLSLHDVGYEGPEDFPLKKQKEVLLSQGSLTRRLRGTWRLTDNATGQKVEDKRVTLASVPHLTQRGTFLLNGTEYVLAHQLRLRPGIYSRRKSNGELEAHVNVMPGKGPSHRLFLDPESGIFRIHVGQADIPLMPLLHTLGAKDSELRQAWGHDLYSVNQRQDSPHYLNRLYERLVKKPDPNAPEEGRRQALINAFNEMELDPDVTRKTLNHPYNRVDKDAILATTKKLVALNRGEAEPDDRDHMAYQTVMGPEDLLSERVGKDKMSLHRLLWQSSFRNGLGHVQPGTFNRAIQTAFLNSGLAGAPEGVNAAEFIDHAGRITRLGEGGLSGGSESIPDESRSVSPSQAFFLDIVKTPESSSAGVDLRLAFGVQKGTDGRLYAPFREVQGGKMVYRSPQQIANLTVAFPGELASGRPHVAAITDGKVKYVARNKVDLESPSMENAFSPLSNLVPLKSAAKGQRVSMGARMITQALPLLQPETPHVRTAVAGQPDRSYEELYGSHMGAIFADQHGRVEKVTPDEITVRYKDGTHKTHELYNAWASPRKTGLHNTPLVQPGQVIGPGQLLAKSNYTDDKGHAALGVNARVAYVPHKGGVYEDSAMISESMAKRLQSEHYYQHKVDFDESARQGKKAFISLFPGKFDRKTLSSLDDNGIIKPGAEVKPGDPLILQARERELEHGKVTHSRKAAFADNTVVWEHHNPGIVTDVVPHRDGINVVVKSFAPMQVGDKLSARWGNKSVVSDILPDEKMPQDGQGRPFEMLWSPLSLLSRINPAWVAEAALGKVAEKTGQGYNIEDWGKIPNVTQFAMDELKKHGLSDTESITDPSTGRKIPGVLTGNNFIMKLHHTSESKSQGRGLGAYSAEGTPIAGSTGGAKKMSLGDTSAILSHGATGVLQDSREHRSSKHDEFWLAYMAGFPTPQAKVPMVYEKFLNDLKASGINVVREGPRLRLMALTNKDVQVLSGMRELENADTVRFDRGLEPVKGGLFDPKLSGGVDGNQWSRITLTEPLPNPAFAEPIRKLLGMTEKSYLDTIAGRQDYDGRKGPEAIAKALENIDIPKAIDQARKDIASGRKGARDLAIKKLSYLKAFEKTGQHPKDWILNAVPVIPPIFRPVSNMAGGRGQLISDPNLLYKELFEANQNLKALKGQLGDVSEERSTLYKAFEGVVGLGDPTSPKNRERGVKGILRGIFGSGPKWSVLQQKLLGTTVDLAGRAVVTPDPDMDMDHVGLPEDKAFDVFKPFVVRRLVRDGMPRTHAIKEVEDRSKAAKDALTVEMQERPVIINRYPLLHKAGLLGQYAKLITGDTIRVSPLITKGMGMDFDGDASQFHVPVSEEAVRDVVNKMLPSRQLYAPATFKATAFLPQMEYLQGLHAASTVKDEQARPKVYADRKSALAAYRRGELSLGHPLDIVNH